MTDAARAGEGAGDAAAVGRELAQAREALGFSIADAAQQLKFAPRQLEALEQGRMEALPAGTFARGMVRAYARLLRLDPAPLVARVAGSTVAPDNAAVIASAKRPIPITDTTRRSNLVYAALSIALLAVIVGVVVEWQRDSDTPEKMTFVPAAQPVPVAPETQQVASAAPLAAPTPAATSAASAIPASPPATVAAPSQAAGAIRRIQLKFDRTSWVEIKGRDGKTLFSQLNPGGTEQVVEGRPPFSLVIGNAHFVRLSYDDRPVDLAPHVKVEVARLTLD